MSTTIRSLDRLAVFLMLVLCASWGFNQITAKIALADVPPLIQAATRSLGATLVLGVIAWVREPRLFARDGSMPGGLLAGVLFGLEFVAIYIGLQWTTAGHATLFLYTAPFFVALGLLGLVPNERLTRLQWIGMALSFVGVALALGVSGTISRDMLIGDLLCVLGGLGWASTTIVLKTTNLRQAPAIKVLLYQLSVSSLVIGAAAFIMGEKWPTSVTTLSWFCMAYQTFWVVCVTFLTWFWLLGRYKAGELSAFTFLTPVIGVFASAVVLNEPIGLQFIMAAGLVAGGLLLVNWPQKA